MRGAVSGSHLLVFSYIYIRAGLIYTLTALNIANCDIPNQHLTGV
jgi:hypothetical protein